MKLTFFFTDRATAAVNFSFFYTVCNNAHYTVWKIKEIHSHQCNFWPKFRENNGDTEKATKELNISYDVFSSKINPFFSPYSYCSHLNIDLDFMHCSSLELLC